MNPGSHGYNCFVSYHHNRDQQYFHSLREIISQTSIFDYSLKRDISNLTDEAIYRKVREKMRNCSVTVVLIGERTGYRKWIDWEIWSSLRSYTYQEDPLKSFKPNGLLGIFLPVKKHAIPLRLQDNLESGYAVSMHWNEVETLFESKIAEAYANRTHEEKIVNHRKRMPRDYIYILGLKL